MKRQIIGPANHLVFSACAAISLFGFLVGSACAWQDYSNREYMEKAQAFLLLENAPPSPWGDRICCR